MRLASNLLFVLAAIAAGLAVLLYFWAHGMACSYSNSGTCRIPPPWELDGENLRFLVLLPWGIVLMIASAAGVLRARSRR